MIGLFDTHCHLDLEDFELDRREVIERAIKSGVDTMLIPSVDLGSIGKIRKIANDHEGIYYAVGVHPNSVEESSNSLEDDLGKLVNADDSGKLVAIGEIGLDNYWKRVGLEAQKRALETQLRVATQYKLPVILHSREENNDRSGQCSKIFLGVLTTWIENMPDRHPLKDRPGVFHSFSGDVELAEKFVSLGFYFGFTGPITYKTAEVNREVVKFLPSNKIIIETDSPYLSPNPHRGKRNEPAYVTQVALKIAETLHEKPETIAAMTTNNARRLFLGEEL